MRTLASFQDVHPGETIIVCGCGASLNEFVKPERFITIGVNDVGRLFQPNYLLVVDPRNRFKEERFHYIETSQASYLFTDHELGIPHPDIVKFALRKMDYPDFSNPNQLHYLERPWYSPYVALSLAAHMGARFIGLIGVDFADNHFFGPTGSYPGARHMDSVERQFRRLNEVLITRGVKVFNLSCISQLRAFPKISLDDFETIARRGLPGDETQSPLRIVSYATSPIAGAPALLSRCINESTPHACRCLWGRSSYPNGVGFEGDLNWNESPNEAEALLRQADVVIVHNGHTDPRHRLWFAGKAIITMVHNSIKDVDTTFVRQGSPGVVVGQSCATLPEYKGWAMVPIPLPLWEKAYLPVEKGEVVTICYTPAAKHDIYPSDHAMYLHSKGYTQTVQILEKLAALYPIQLAVRERPMEHTEVLSIKQRAHIVIDECVTGGYHTNSLEGLAAGCVVVNSVGLLPEVIEALGYCIGKHSSNPFVFANLETLEGMLTWLIERGAYDLIEEGKQNRRWMEHHWDFAWQWRRFWMPVITQALNQVNNVG